MCIKSSDVLYLQLWSLAPPATAAVTMDIINARLLPHAATSAMTSLSVDADIPAISACTSWERKTRFVVLKVGRLLQLLTRFPLITRNLLMRARSVHLLVPGADPETLEGGGARNMKYMLLRAVAIFFMTFLQAGVATPPCPPPPDPLLRYWVRTVGLDNPN